MLMSLASSNSNKFAVFNTFLHIGEPEFVERMQRTYHDKAVTNHVSIVHCCGFDSVSFLF